ncbi:MAG TPA: VTT domain-containing protein [Opitutaceae bacterium]|nr:VTT domain-containing protein [Opitutaceae bacterium]
MTTPTAAHALSRLPGWWISFVTWTSHLGTRGLVVFLAAYVVATLCFVPNWILRLGAGFVFGLAKGLALAAAGTALGAVAAFFLSRRWLRGAVRRRWGASRALATVERAIELRGAQIVLLLRVCPVLPASLLNYLLGVTGIRFRTFLGATCLGMLPGVALYAYLGAVSRTEVAAALHHGWGPGRVGLLAAGVLVALLAAAEILKPWRRRAPLKAAAAPAASDPTR